MISWLQIDSLWNNYIWVQQENLPLQPRLETELGGGPGQELEAGPDLASDQVEAASQRGGVGHCQHLEARGSQEQMRINKSDLISAKNIWDEAQTRIIIKSKILTECSVIHQRAQ